MAWEGVFYSAGHRGLPCVVFGETEVHRSGFLLENAMQGLREFLTLLVQTLPGLEASSLVEHEGVPAVLKFPGGHDGDAGPSPLQGAQPLLILSHAVDAGGIEVQAHVAIVPQKLSHTLGTISTGAPGEKAGDPVLVFRVQVPGLDLL